MLLCTITQKHGTFIELEDTHSGWLVFTGIKDKHRKSRMSEFIILPAWQMTEGIHENHGAPKFNTILSTPDLKKEYDNMIPGNEKDAYLMVMEPNDKKIREIQAFVRFYKSSNNPQNPLDCEKWLLSLLKTYQ